VLDREGWHKVVSMATHIGDEKMMMMKKLIAIKNFNIVKSLNASIQILFISMLQCNATWHHIWNSQH